MGLLGGSRPVFDFEGSLELARRLHEFAYEIRDEASPRYEARNSLLDTWVGVHGDDFRLRADDENQSYINVLVSLRDEGEAWADAWVLAVEETNRVVYAEAVEVQRAYIDQQQAQRNGFEKVTDGVTDFLWGSDNEFDHVPVPASPMRPRPDGFMVKEPPFASYRRQGDRLQLTYLSVPPSSAVN